MHGQDKLFQTKSIVKTTNPKWDEHFSVHIDNPFKPITLQVFDKDLVGSDDFMGEASIELTDLNLDMWVVKISAPNLWSFMYLCQSF